MSRLTDEQVNDLWGEHAGPEHGFTTPPWIRFARAIESAVLNTSDDSSGAVGKGVQPPDGTTERERFIGALRHVAELQPDPRLSIDAVMTVFDYVVGARAEPSMSTTSPSADSGTDELKAERVRRLHSGLLRWHDSTASVEDARRLLEDIEGGAKP